MSKINTPDKILFHSDFDGICSAAVLKKYFGNNIKLLTLNYPVDPSWYKKSFINSAVVDFLFHPDASWWFDHHETSFKNEKLKNLYKADERHRWETSYSSCPPLILDVLSEKEDIHDLKNYFKDWIHWADIIDSASYKSAHEAILGEHPCLLINQALSYNPNYQFRIKLVNLITSGHAPDDIAHQKWLTSYWGPYREKQLKSLRKMERRIKIFANVGYCDMTSSSAAFIRYGNYFIEENLDYSVIAYRDLFKKHSWKISLSANPFKPKLKSKINLGLLAKKYGGGGRIKVGSIALSKPKECRLVGKLITEEIAFLSKE